MSDFFSHLIDRAFAHSQTVMPRRPSLYEPAPSGVSLAGVEPLEVSSIAEDPREPDRPALSVPGPAPLFPPAARRSETVTRNADEIEPAPPRPVRTEPRAAGVEAPTIHPTLEWPTSRETDEPAATASPARPSPIERHLVENRIETIRTVERVDVDAEGLLSRLRAALAGPEGRQEVAQTDVRSDTPSVALPRDASPTETAEAQIDAFTAAAHPVVARIAGDETPPMSPRPRAEIAEAVRSPAPAVPPTRLAPPASRVEPEPTIQVSIGRIEVRAATAPAPTHRPAPRPRLTLDEYLQRREGGKR